MTVAKVVMQGIKQMRANIEQHKKALHKKQITALNDLGTIVSDRIRVSMIETKKTKDETKWVKRGKKRHKPSIPGSPPAEDRSNLIKSINYKTVEEKGRGLVCFVGSMTKVPYAAALEFGRLDGHIAPRPYIRPVVGRSKKIIVNKLEEASKP